MKLNPRVTQIILSEMNEDLRMKLKIDRAKKCEEMLIDNQLVNHQAHGGAVAAHHV